jgi:tetratricopeptide (TPR) repeat protein
MNKEIFNQLIKEPSKVHPKYQDELKRLVDAFPYASDIRILYLSSLFNGEDILFEQELKKTAAYISDRRILKKIIHNQDSQDDYIINESETEVNLVDNKSASIVNETLKTQNTDKRKKTSEIAQDESVKSIAEDENVNSTTLETPIKLEKTEGNAEKEKNPDQTKFSTEEVDELDNLIVSSAIDASLSLEIEDATNKLKADKENSQKKKSKNPVKTSIQEEPKTFLEWISTSNFEKTKVNQKESERLKFRKRAESLIDQFIENQPKIKPKVAFYSPENMAQKSIEDSKEIVTETLAKVYADQGNIEKAKSIYKQLILNNPEKKTYFVSLLKKLRED